MSETGVGVIGLGFMGRTHVGAYLRANDAGYRNRLVAVCDADPDRRAGRPSRGGNIETMGGTAGGTVPTFDPAAVRAYETPDALLADGDVQLVSICTPTVSHAELAEKALAAGKHVLLEKPIALTLSDAERLAAAARDAKTLCMPAMCMRFWPAWKWLKDRVKDDTYGEARSAVFRRLGTRPAWADFYSSAETCGGALLDLHIHDADFIRWTFGTPDEVVSTGSLDHVTTLYRYKAGPAHVVAEGGWDHTDGFPFRMQFTVVFEYATIDYEFGRVPDLQLVQVGSIRPIPVEPIDGYDGEVRHLLDAIRAGKRELRVKLDDAVKVMGMLEDEKAGLRR